MTGYDKAPTNFLWNEATGEETIWRVQKNDKTVLLLSVFWFNQI